MSENNEIAIKEISHDDLVSITQDDLKFRMHMIETVTRTDVNTQHLMADVSKLQSQNNQQFNKLADHETRLVTMELEPRKSNRRMAGMAATITAIASGIVYGIVEAFRGGAK